MNLTQLTRKLSRAVHTDRLPDSASQLAMPILAHILEQKSVRNKLLPTHQYQISCMYTELTKRQALNPKAHRQKTIDALSRIKSRYATQPTLMQRLRPLTGRQREESRLRQRMRNTPSYRTHRQRKAYFWK